MSLAVVSLIWDAKSSPSQRVSYDDDGYHLVRFPFGGESYDPWKMHDPANGGGDSEDFPHARSGLIYPSHEGWGIVSAMVHWEKDGDPHEYRARFVRDPLGDEYDSTATTDAAETGGGQYKSYMWQFFVHPGTPLGLKVSARGRGDKKIATPLRHAQFKLAIHTDVMKP
ncbi:hypothetical protein H181DRAFT_00362 [Streptomyces sp. WMMB 714]|uniref:hypothetical protein n=1 Tax=Streptomyces sp. WMMB 714 TaxID=1286822 RepID=UPI0005F7DD57|nr:hypothetical protein [Streptomyces sp. WMMB 714]SCK08343.1 hypothetical protein H181DRAFT_00362 [Streptomyces sp. WMMB 714]